MRRGIAALGAFAAVTALAACSGSTTPAATDNDGGDPHDLGGRHSFPQVRRSPRTTTQALPLTSFRSPRPTWTDSPPRCPPATAPT